MAFGKYVAVVLGIAVYFLGTKLERDADKFSVQFDDLPSDIRRWRDLGQTVTINGHEMFFIYKKCRDKTVENPATFALVHGFPSSSYDYHKVIDELAMYGNVFVNDHLGFGLSDFPVDNYTYSLGEAAENLLSVWRHAGLRQPHIIAHDMGDSVVTEILARRHRKMLPAYFDGFFQSVTFTNGGMRFDMVNFRITQSICMYPAIAKPLAKLGNAIGATEYTFKKQVLSVWSPFVEDVEERDREIHNIYILNAYKNKIMHSYKLCYYLWDRSNFEFRWFDALRELDIPSRFIWSDSDAVSPVTIPQSFEMLVPDFKMVIVKQSGHFWMLENPKRWIEEAVKVLH